MWSSFVWILLVILTSMLYEFQYDLQPYMVEIEEVIMIPDGHQVSQTEYPESDEDPRKFRVQLFRIEDDERLTPLIISKQPEDFRLQFEAEFSRIASKMATYVANPYFDEVMIFYGETVVTSNDRHAPVTCEQCRRPSLFERREKENKTEYIKSVHAKLQAKANPEWPFKENLSIQYSVSDMQSRLNKIDLDNLSKTICDSLQGMVFSDDAQIVRLAADKDYVGGLIAHVVAIKRLAPGERPQFQDYLFSGRLDAWQEEYAQKQLQNKGTRFLSY
jgi:Holliday junction resolvase RusA-like endonuclease